MKNALIRKLELLAPLAADDQLLLDRIGASARAVPAHAELVREGDRPGAVHFVLEGFACRCKYLADGGRQIVSILLPGDGSHVNVPLLGAMDHTVMTLSECRVAEVARADMQDLLERPALARAMAWAGLVDAAVLQEWLVNIGRRQAEARIAHLICEMQARLGAVGLADGAGYRLPLTQQDLADATGLSAVHVNRALQALRARRLISLQSHRLIMIGAEELAEISGFNAGYLHLGGGARPGDGLDGRGPAAGPAAGATAGDGVPLHAAHQGADIAN